MGHGPAAGGALVVVRETEKVHLTSVTRHPHPLYALLSLACITTLFTIAIRHGVPHKVWGPDKCSTT